TNTEGAPLSGAGVTVGAQGSVTNAQGQFTIPNIAAGTHTISASLIGYATQSRASTGVAGQDGMAHVQLAGSAVQLEGIVAVGYGTTRSQDVTGAVASVSPEAIADLPVPGATQALAAQIPGVNVLTATGAPGAGAQIQVRGVSAIGAGGS